MDTESYLASSQVKIHIGGLPQYGIARPGSLMANSRIEEEEPAARPSTKIGVSGFEH